MIRKKNNWIALVKPTNDEISAVQTEYNVFLEQSKELEYSARFYEEDGLHIHSFFYKDGIKTISFTIKDNMLFTMSDQDLNSKKEDISDIVVDLFENKVAQLADVIENIYAKLETHTQENDQLSSLIKSENICSHVRLCLTDTERAISFLLRNKFLSHDQAEDLLRDIKSLLPFNESLFQKINFLMQVTMGLINIEQNKIMKFFSVVSVMFLPAMLIASIYGMNFDHIPELHYQYAYPIVLGVMVFVVIGIYFYFKKKKWI